MNKFVLVKPNNIWVLNELPDDLNILICSNCNLNTLPALPNTLKQLICSNNNLIELPQLPNGLQILNCSNNRLTELPQLPNTLKKIICSNNNLSELPKLPESIGELDCRENPIQRISLDGVVGDINLRIDIENLDLDSLYSLRDNQARIISYPLLGDRIEQRILLLEQYIQVAHKVRKTLTVGPTGVSKPILENDLMKQVLTNLGVDIKTMKDSGLGRKKIKKKTKRKRVVKKKTRRKY
jgi:hypothetical protein